MTTQEAYEEIREYFSRPGAVRAQDDDGTCLYLTPDGNKCAVGCLIPDEIFQRPATAGSRFLSLAEQLNNCGSLDGLERMFYAVPELKTLLNGDDEEGRKKFHFLREAQATHDSGSMDVTDFLMKLDKLAMSHGLRRY